MEGQPQRSSESTSGEAHKRRRIWCELLPPQELGSPATVALLRRFSLEPLIALPPSAQTPAMHRALRRLAGAGVAVGLWPLLADQEGYWPNAESAGRYALRVRQLLAWRRDVPVRCVAVDLEPPLAELRQLTSVVGAGCYLVRQLLSRREAPASLDAVIRRLCQSSDRETLTAILPPVVFDLASGSRLWQRLLQTPVAPSERQILSAMTYSSIIAAVLPGGWQAARGLIYGMGALLRDAVGAGQASLSLGLLTAGKLGDEPVLPQPDTLRLDVGAARAAGVDDLALFSLEGAIWRGDPERWLIPFTTAPPRRPASPAARAVIGITTAAARLQAHS